MPLLITKVWGLTPNVDNLLITLMVSNNSEKLLKHDLQKTFVPTIAEYKHLYSDRKKPL